MEKKTFVDQCTEYVIQIEDNYLIDLLVRLSECEHDAETCTCATCKASVPITKNRVDKEIKRLDSSRHFTEFPPYVLKKK